MGVWIKRDIAADIGPFDTHLTIGEDTDYSCRLIRHGTRAWYSAEMRVMIHVHNNPRDQAPIGKSRTIAPTAEDMRIIATRFPEFRLLGQKYLRLCAQVGQTPQARHFVRSQNGFGRRLWFSILYRAKRLIHSFKRRKPA